MLHSPILPPGLHPHATLTRHSARIWPTSSDNVQPTPNVWQCCVWIGLIQCCYGVATTLKMKVISHHCINVATLLENCLIFQCCHNIDTLLKTMLYHNIPTMVRQCCVNADALHSNPSKLKYSGNIVITLWQHWKIMHFQCCQNVVSISPQSCRPTCTNNHVMLYQHWEITSFSMLPKHYYNGRETLQELGIYFPI